MLSSVAVTSTRWSLGLLVLLSGCVETLDGDMSGVDPEAPEPADLIAAPPRPASLITTSGGKFLKDGQPWRPIGVNYFYPHYAQPFYQHTKWDWVTVWGAPEFPNLDADREIEDDFTVMQFIGVNEIRLAPPQTFAANDRDPATYPTPARSYCARLRRVLDLAGAHKIHVTVVLPFGRPSGSNNFTMAASWADARAQMAYPVRVIDACGLASRSEIVSYGIDQEGEVEFAAADKFKNRGSDVAIGLWNQWLIERYGSVAQAQKKWGQTLKLECLAPKGTAAGAPVTNRCPDLDEWDAGCERRGTRVCPPRMEKVTSGGEVSARWPAGDTDSLRAWARFTDWVMNRRFQRAREILKEHDPYHLISQDSILQDGYCSSATFLRREQTKYVDYSGVHIYHASYTGSKHWNAATFTGFDADADKYRGTAAALAWMNPGRRPVTVGEIGVSVLGNCKVGEFCVEGDKAARDKVQQRMVPFEASILASGGARGYRWWWWRGIRPMGGYADPARPGARDREVSDYGINDVNGVGRAIMTEFGKSRALFDAIDSVPAVIRTVDAAPACSRDILTPEIRTAAATAVKQGKPFRLSTQCSGKDTTNGPDQCLEGGGYFNACGAGNAEHCCPMVCFDSLFEQVQVLGADGLWQDAREGQTITVTRDAPVRVRVKLGNVGESAWAASSTGSGVAKLAISGSGVTTTRAALPATLPSFGSTPTIEVTPIARASAATTFTLKMVAEGRFFFGEPMTVRIAPTP